MSVLKPITIDLGSVDIGAGGTTTAIEICFNYNWSISPTVTGTPGNSDYTLEVSHDGVEWKEYKDGSTNVDIEDAIQDDILPFTYVRIVVNSGGGSSGTAQFSMQLKNN
jgi:hypothetical protein